MPFTPNVIGVFKQQYMKNISSTEVLQMEVAEYLSVCYPEAFFTPLVNNQHIGEQLPTTFKQLRGRTGIPDLLIFDPISEKDRFGEIIWIKKCGLAIEFKTNPDKLTHEKKNALVALTGRGWKTAICYSFEQAKQVIDAYFYDDRNI